MYIISLRVRIIILSLHYPLTCNEYQNIITCNNIITLSPTRNVIPQNNGIDNEKKKV